MPCAGIDGQRRETAGFTRVCARKCGGLPCCGLLPAICTIADLTATFERMPLRGFNNLRRLKFGAEGINRKEKISVYPFPGLGGGGGRGGGTLSGGQSLRTGSSG